MMQDWKEQVIRDSDVEFEFDTDQASDALESFQDKIQGFGEKLQGLVVTAGDLKAAFDQGFEIGVKLSGIDEARAQLKELQSFGDDLEDIRRKTLEVRQNEIDKINELRGQDGQGIADKIEDLKRTIEDRSKNLEALQKDLSLIHI